MLEEDSNGAITDYIYVNGTPVATLVPATGRVYFLHTDHLSTPQLATDGTQRPMWSTAYQPFGAAALINGSITQNLRLPGQYAMRRSASITMASATTCRLGRYLESDPIGLVGSWDRIANYSYDSRFGASLVVALRRVAEHLAVHIAEGFEARLCCLAS